MRPRYTYIKYVSQPFRERKCKVLPCCTLLWAWFLKQMWKEVLAISFAIHHWFAIFQKLWPIGFAIDHGNPPVPCDSSREFQRCFPFCHANRETFVSKPQKTSNLAELREITMVQQRHVNGSPIFLRRANISPANFSEAQRRRLSLRVGMVATRFLWCSYFASC